LVCSTGQRQLKRLPSEGDDKSESCLEGKTDLYKLITGFPIAGKNRAVQGTEKSSHEVN